MPLLRIEDTIKEGVDPGKFQPNAFTPQQGNGCIRVNRIDPSDCSPLLRRLEDFTYLNGNPKGQLRETSHIFDGEPISRIR